MIAKIGFAILLLLVCGGQVLVGLVEGVVWFGLRRYRRTADPGSFWTCVIFWAFFGAVGLGIVVRN